MCGIAGILSLRGEVDRGRLERFTRSLAHRGPDGEGLWIDRNIGLGHRRLSILDLSENGACPMSYVAPDGRNFFITYNGEVYNFLELRKELESDGYRFRSDSDTEVIVASYARWGQDCLQKFNGMWAFAIWDCRERSLLLARDRFGVKPLYYAQSGKDFCFASEIKAFCFLDGFDRRLDEGAAKAALERSQVLEGTASETLMRGVKRVMPGFLMRIDETGKTSFAKWWETRNHLRQVPASYEKQVEEWRGLFFDAVRLRLRSDVSLGTSLSGGLDSSSVAAAVKFGSAGPEPISRLSPSTYNCFVSTFPGTALDETQYAAEVAESLGARPVYSIFRADNAIGRIPQSVWAMEDVYPAIAVPLLGNYEAMRSNNVVVSLDGHGADEMLGGYHWYLSTPMNQLNDRLYTQFHVDLLPSILKNFDRCSMASGVEVRMPFMDWRLVCYTFSLGSEAKIGGGYTKRILRDAMSGLLPDSIRLRRQKIGFNAPMIEWFNQGLGGLVETLTAHPRWSATRAFDPRKVADELLVSVRNRAFGQNDWAKCLHFWTCLNLVLWEILFLDGNRSLLEKSPAH